MDIRVGPEAPDRAAAWIARRLRDAHRRRGVAHVALSGGSTAPPMIGALIADDVPWEAVTVWQVDERVVPDGHTDRNAVQLATLPCDVEPMPVTSRDLARAARRYGDRLPPRLDVVHLGLGEDGHTASWPPGDDGPIRSAHPVEMIELFNGWSRMTMTRRVVNNARSRVVLAAGSAKREMVRRWLLEDRSLPISAVRSSDTWVFLDSDAAPPGFEPSL